MNVISVLCPPDTQLHLAPYERGERSVGVNVLTLCLERWSTREPAREGSKFCPECFERWSGNQPQEENQ